jgi:hypothetical protein
MNLKHCDAAVVVPNGDNGRNLACIGCVARQSEDEAFLAAGGASDPAPTPGHGHGDVDSRCIELSWPAAIKLAALIEAPERTVAGLQRSQDVIHKRWVKFRVVQTLAAERFDLPHQPPQLAMGGLNQGNALRCAGDHATPPRLMELI